MYMFCLCKCVFEGVCGSVQVYVCVHVRVCDGLLSILNEVFAGVSVAYRKPSGNTWVI